MREILRQRRRVIDAVTRNAFPGYIEYIGRRTI